MAAAAPIKVSDDVKKAFLESQENSDFGFINLGINFDTNEFELLASVNKGSSDEETWTSMLQYMIDKTHTLIITRDPMDSKLMLLIHFAPDLSPVKQRMLYASSRSKLKQQLGQAMFSTDYHISKREECSPSLLVEQRTLHEKIEFRSQSEIDKAETSHEASAKSVRGQVMKNLPITMEDSGKSAINNYISGETKCVFLSLKKEDQSIIGEEQKANSIDDIRELLPENEPRYVMFLYSDSSGDSNELKQIFGYYCPEKSDRNLRFTYSTCKANLIEYCTQINLTFFARIELSSKGDFKPEYLDYHVFPKQEVKETFAKPKSGGKKGKKPRKKLDV